ASFEAHKSTGRRDPVVKPTRSVRRASGFVQVAIPETELARLRFGGPLYGFAVTQPRDVNDDDGKFRRRNWTLVFSRFVPQSGSRNRAGSPSAQTPSKPLRPLHPINVDRRTG